MSAGPNLSPWVVALMLALLALVAIGTSIPLVLGKIRPNHLYGIRFEKSFSSEESWYRINRVGGWALIIWGAVTLGVAAACFLPIAAPQSMLWTLFLGWPLTIFVPIWVNWEVAKKL